MNKKIFCVAIFLGVLSLGIGYLGGCGKVTGPISPLVNPTTILFNFDDGVAGNINAGVTNLWAYDSSNPYNFVSAPAVTVTSKPVFQGSYALEIDIPHLVPNGSVSYYLTSYSVGVTYSSSASLNLTGKTLSMWVYLKSGLVSPPNQVGAQIFLKDTSYKYANGAFFNLTPNEWMQVTYNVNAPSYTANPDPSSVFEVGLQIAGSGSAVFTSDGVVVADSFGYQ